MRAHFIASFNGIRVTIPIIPTKILKKDQKCRSKGQNILMNYHTSYPKEHENRSNCLRGEEL